MMGRRYFPLLLALIALFLLRVAAQLIQAVHAVPWLPSFAAWHGAVLPYPLLVGLQLVIIIVLAWLAWRVRTDAISPARWKYRACFTFGGVYFAFMAVRLVGGLTVLAGHSWFAKSLPAAFHLVLAAFILLLGHYIYRRGAEAADAAGREPRA